MGAPPDGASSCGVSMCWTAPAATAGRTVDHGVCLAVTSASYHLTKQRIVTGWLTDARDDNVASFLVSSAIHF